MWAMWIQASLDAMDFSQSLASPRHRPSHAKLRSTTQRRGGTSKPLALSERFRPEYFLRLLRDFTVFGDRGDGVFKIIAGYHQFHGARKALARR